MHALQHNTGYLQQCQPRLWLPLLATVKKQTIASQPHAHSGSNLNMRTPLGPIGSVLIREVSWYQWWNNTCLYCVGTKWSVQYRRGVLISGCPHLGVLLYVPCWRQLSLFHCCLICYLGISLYHLVAIDAEGFQCFVQEGAHIYHTLLLTMAYSCAIRLNRAP